MPGSERAPEGWRGWPDGKQFALVLTHDVEGQVGLDKCRQLMRVEMELGFRSSFNFVPEGTYGVPRELREELVRNGFEVGVHDLKHDGRLYRSRREFSQRAARINRYLGDWGAVGFRSGFMLHNLNWLHELDIQYDMSTFDTDPFEPQPEGRNTVFPFWVPRPLTHNSHPVTSESTCNHLGNGYIELPYTLPQDSTLFLLLREETPEIWLRKLDWIAEHGGMVLLDTHPDYMALDGSTPNAVEYRVELYRQLLDYVSSKYSDAYWLALPAQVAAHARQNINISAHQSEPEPISSRSFASEKIVESYAHKLPPTAVPSAPRLRGKRAAVLLFSHYPADPRPRRAAEALAAEGATVDLICLKENAKEPRREKINGVSVFRIPLNRHRGSKMSYIGEYSTFILISFAYLTFRSFARRYDFIHVHNMPDVLVFSALVPKALGARVILDLHDPMPELMQTIFKLPEESVGVRILKRLEKWSIGFADSVLTVNLACKKIYSSRSCLPEKINVVLNSPDDHIFQFRSPNSHFSNGKDPTKRFVILYHGSLVQRNGFDLAVDALETAKKSIPSARLMVCGERTPFFEKVMESVRERGLQGER